MKKKNSIMSNKMKLLWQDEEYRKKQIESRKNSVAFQNKSKQQSKTLKKTYEEHPEIKQQISETLKKTYEEHPEILINMGKKQTQRYKDNPEILINMSKNKKEAYNTTIFREKMSKIKKDQIKENPEKFFKISQKGGIASSKKLTSEERIKRSVNAYKGLKRISSIEKLIAEELTKRNIYFIQQMSIMDKYRVDFLVNDNIIIEADGIYWHCLPYIKEKDKIRDETLRNNGFRVFRFWEDDIKKDVSRCIEKIKEYLI